MMFSQVSKGDKYYVEFKVHHNLQLGKM